MTEQTDAPEPIETTEDEVTTDVEATETEEVEAEQKSDELSESSTETVEDKPKANPAQKRIDELTGKRREAERDRDYWREQAMSNKPAKPKEVTEEEPLKTLQDFDYDEAKYQQHIVDQVSKQAVNAAKQTLKDDQSQQTSARKLTAFRSREAEFAKDVDDYHESVSNRDLAFSQAMVDVTNDMDNGPEIRYHLSKNPDLSYEIANLPPMAAARELGRIEANIESQKKAGETVSKAPKPAPKIAAIEPSISKDPYGGTQEEYNEHRRKVIAKRNK